MYFEFYFIYNEVKFDIIEGKTVKTKIKKWWKNGFQSNSIFKQLVTFTLLISMVPILVGSLFLGHKITKLAGDMVNNSYSNVVVQYILNIEERLFQYKNRINQISENTIIRDNLLGYTGENNPYIKGATVSVEVAKTLQLETSTDLRNCMIYSNISDIPIYGKRVTTMDGASREAWYLQDRLNESDSFSYWTVGGRNRIFSIVQSMVYVDARNFVSQKIGFLKLDIYAAKLFTPAKKEMAKNYLYDIVVFDSKDELVYSSNKNYDNVLMDIPIDQLNAEQMYSYGDSMVYRAELEEYGLRVIFFFEGSQFNKEKNKVVFSYLPFVLIIVALVIISTYSFARNFSKRIELLVQKIKMAETGNLTVTEKIEGNDEIAVLDRKFNHMLKQLDILIQRNYIQKLENKENELRNLQLQINPHFLYNTLETISSMAAIHQMFGICDICEKLGEIFRYSLGKNYGNYVTVEQELQHVKNYIFIQKARFGNKFEVFYNVEKDIEKKQILRFILQPIVENAIIHGISPCTTSGTLEINIYKENNCIYLIVEDDGVGISPDKVEELREYIDRTDNLATDSKRSIGIKNVNQRIKLTCGENYGITIKSELNCGSSFIIKLPLISNKEA